VKSRPKGTLIIIGGREEKDEAGDQAILTAVCRPVIDGKGALVITTVATELPDELAREYQDVFKRLGVQQIELLDIRTRDEAYADAAVARLRGAAVVFFTGGNQLRIVSQLGGTPVYACLEELFAKGATIAGTSAGAAAMSDTMLIAGPGDESYELSTLGMAPGLGLIGNVVIDSHFAERGRFGRLLGAVAQNPRNRGVGIDEDTAIVAEHDIFRVIGSGAVYVMDGTEISYSSLAERTSGGVLTVHDVRLHVLAGGDRFDLGRRRPLIPT
jgi:cyanophycinase